MMERARTWSKSWLLRFLPRDLIDVVLFIGYQLPRGWKKHRIEAIFMRASNTPDFLDRCMLPVMQKKFRHPAEYGYDPQTLKVRGSARARQLLCLPGMKHGRSFLELGCWDGMVCSALAEKGKVATGIDQRSSGFDSRAQGSKVHLMKMDASDLKFPDESFDCVYSYDAFEHFEDPEAVFQEAIRVTVKRGYIYLDFGPLYYSPYGEHAYRSITVPYCQFLFTRDALDEFAARNKLKPIDFKHVNGWSVEEYRQLWNRYTSVLKKVRYREVPDWSHLDLIRQYPSCFKSKSAEFANFMVGHIRILFQKTGDFATRCHS
jgi:ubiquinone/menaquinone biosynthesis C-methylase UbiE